jgi:MarR family transcriptional regulator, transcriptional regulator for hemolysin
METLGSIFFYNLDKAIKAYRQYAQVQLKKNGFDVTVDQWLVLKSISDNSDIQQNELSELVFKDKASVTRIIDVLVAAKLLTRDSHPESGRRRQLSITTKGRKLLKDIQPYVLKNRKQALKNISEKEIAIAEKVLKTISSNCKK